MGLLESKIAVITGGGRGMVKQQRSYLLMKELRLLLLNLMKSPVSRLPMNWVHTILKLILVMKKA